ncbi:MAG: hypothetical protein AAB397_00865 [Patescibacteria group bacterium]
MNKKSLIVILVIIIVVSVGTITYFGMKNIRSKIFDETVLWKTYHSEQYGFEIRVPKKWDYRTDEFPEKLIFYSNNPYIGYNGCGVYKEFTDQRDVLQWYKYYYQQQKIESEFKDQPFNLSAPEKFRYVTFNGYSAIEANSLFAFDKSITEIYLTHNNKIFNCSYPDSDPNDSNFKNNYELYKRVASTFRFTE